MSAMVTQISFENNEHSAMQESKIAEESTEPETLDELFEHYEREIQYDTNLAEREPEDEEFSMHQLKGVLPSEINLYDTQDASTNPLQTLPQCLIEDNKQHALLIANREKEAARNLVLPGCNRFMMPDVPTKSKRLRDFENPQFYPFSTLPVEDAERTMQLKAFQQLIKSNGLDEGAKPKDRLSKLKVFERKYDQYLEEDIFRQVFQRALLQDPDLSTYYYERSD